MVDPLEILPVLAMAIAIACIPILGDGPFARPAKPQRRRHRPHQPDRRVTVPIVPRRR